MRPPTLRTSGAQGFDQLFDTAGGGTDLQPPICGQAFIKKVRTLGKNSKRGQRTLLETPQSASSAGATPFWSSAPRSNSAYLRCNVSEYDGIISLEQAMDTMSNSSRSNGSRKSGKESTKREENTPCLVQFDPAELEQIKKDKQEADLKAAQRVARKKHGKREHNHVRHRILYWASNTPNPLTPVAEEGSFTSSMDSKSPLPRGADEATSPLLQSFHFHSAENESPLDSGSEEGSDKIGRKVEPRGKMENSNHFTQWSASDDKSDGIDEVQKKKSLDGSSSGSLTFEDALFSNFIASPERMDVVSAMRETLIKQQEAIKLLSEQNNECKALLLACQREMSMMKQENSEQQERIGKLIREKETFHSEGVWLMNEVKTLKQQIEEMKADDEKLQAQYRSLMEEPHGPLNDIDSLGSDEDYFDSDYDDDQQNQVDTDSRDQAGACKVLDQWNRLLEFERKNREISDECRDDNPFDERSDSRYDSEKVGSTEENDREEAGDLVDEIINIASKRNAFNKNMESLNTLDATPVASSGPSSAMEQESKLESEHEIVVTTEKTIEKSILSPNDKVDVPPSMFGRQDNIHLFQERLDAIQKKRNMRRQMEQTKPRTPRVQFSL
jgi:hypothetical protein